VFGKTRQAYYKYLKEQKEQLYNEAVVVKLITGLRDTMPRIGGRKLFHMLKTPMLAHNIDIGRDGFYDIMYQYGLTLRRRKRRRIITTDSNHPFYKYPNLIKGLLVIAPDRLWVSDITYIALTMKFSYLSLVTDSYSRKIVGYCLYPTLEKQGPLTALKMALKQASSTEHLIHHSDRGLQYCCKDYIDLLERKGVTVSMTEKGDPYENAIAERVNGILKSEFMLDKYFKNFDEAQQAVDKAILIYNQNRPHSSCDYLTPEQAHQHSGLLQKRWKTNTVNYL
jgi:putative transposase